MTAMTSTLLSLLLIREDIPSNQPTAIMQAMIFAAGLGTRLQPLTADRPKALVTLAGRPLIDHVIDKLRAAEMTRIIVNVHHFADMLCSHLQQMSYPDIDIVVSDERQLLLDTGGGVRQALSLIDTSQPLLLHNVDIISTTSLPAFISEAQRCYSDCHCDAALMVSPRPSTRYLLFDDRQQMRGWTNTATGEIRPMSLTDTAIIPSLQRRAFSGIHMLFPEIYPLLQSYPQRFGITDFYIQTCQQRTFVGIDTPHDTLIDVGRPDTLAAAERLLTENC